MILRYCILILTTLFVGFSLFAFIVLKDLFYVSISIIFALFLNIVFALLSSKSSEN